MSSEATRITAIFGAVALVTAAGAFYFFKIYQPGQIRADAQADIIAWEARWAAARACLLGPVPGSSRTSEALAIHELSPDPWARGGCTKLVARLSRGDGADSGMLEVEAAWSELDRAAAKAAQAFATHVAPTGPTRIDPWSATLAGLPAALDELDAARAKLRAAAQLPDDTATIGPLPLAQLIALRDGADPVTDIVLARRELPAIASAHGLELFARTANHTVQLSLAAGSAPKIDRIGPRSRRAQPDTTWGATVVPLVDGTAPPFGGAAGRGTPPVADTGDGEVHAGAIDAEGALAQPTTLRLGDARAASFGPLVIAAAIGTRADRIIAYHTATRLAIARGGAQLMTEPVVVVDEQSPNGFEDLDGRAVVVWSVAGTWYARMMKPGVPGTPVEVARPDAACFSRDRAWLHADDVALYPLVDQTLGPRQLSAPELVGCAPDGAVARDLSADLTRYAVCTDRCRAVTLPAAPNHATVTLVDGKLVAIATHERVLAVWSETAPPRYFSLPAPIEPIDELPLMALTDGRVIDVVSRDRDGLAIIRIPAR